MKVDDKILRDVLQRKIKQVNDFPKSALRDVENWMANKYNVKHGDTVGILNGTIPIEILNYEMLYKLMKSIHDGLEERWMDIDLSELNERKYFTDIEIEQFEKPIINKDYNDDIIFTEWVQIASDQYVTKASIDEIIQWRNSNKVKYNPDTQRDMTVKNYKGVNLQVVTLNKKSVKEIYQLMVENQFIPDDLTLNINTDINISSNQLPKVVNNNLIIPKEAQIDIIDGFHRFYTMCMVKDANPSWQFTCVFNIVMYDTEKANTFMLQRDKKNHLSKKQVTRIDKSSEVNYVIDRLNDSSKFHLKGKIDDETYYHLNTIITDVFNPTAREESVPLYKKIEKNINILVEEKEYFNKTFSKEEWFIYLYLIQKAEENNIDYISLIDMVDMEYLIDEIEYKNKPSKKHYRLIDKIVEEVDCHV